MMSQFKNLFRAGIVLIAISSIAGCSSEFSEPAESSAEEVVKAAIAAHGGAASLRAAATWKAEIRRHQRGSSYVMTNYYRPGMVRLEQDQGNGERSGDVIGDPHCWGMAGVVSLTCSDETRENDRPRVIMEMAMQLWPLLEEDWELRSASQSEVGGRSFDIVEAFFKPRDSLATFSFDQETHLLESISIAGIKGDVKGTHLHVYSDYGERCGVQMPGHNEKSFEGETWVSEDVLELQCMPVEESMFVRPAQVLDGAITDTNIDAGTLACVDRTASDDASHEDRIEFQDLIASVDLIAVDSPKEYLHQDGSSELCVAIQDEQGHSDPRISFRAALGGNARSIYAVDELGDRKDQFVASLLASVDGSGDSPSWPIQVTTFDYDGMGLTGEVVVELSVLIDR